MKKKNDWILPKNAWEVYSPCQKVTDFFTLYKHNDPHDPTSNVRYLIKDKLNALEDFRAYYDELTRPEFK